MTLEDLFTDLHVEKVLLPLDEPRDDWLGHEGIVQSAIYVKTHLTKGHLLQRAFAIAQVYLFTFKK